MQTWRVQIWYGCGYTKDKAWEEHARRLLESQGWLHIYFWNDMSENFCQSSGRVGDDEIKFVVVSDADRKAIQANVDQVLQQIGIEGAEIQVEESKE